LGYQTFRKDNIETYSGMMQPPSKCKVSVQTCFETDIYKSYCQSQVLNFVEREKIEIGLQNLFAQLLQRHYSSLSLLYEMDVSHTVPVPSALPLTIHARKLAELYPPSPFIEAMNTENLTL
jgi:hypothetical protein